MSARSATQRSPRPTSQTRPVPPGRMRGSRPAAVSRWPTSAVVRCSARPSSGAACSARRQATTSDRCSASHESSQAGPLPAPMSTTAGPVAGTTAGVLLQDRHRTPPPLDSSWCISSYSSPGRRCSKQIRPTNRNARRGVADLLRTGARRVVNGRTRDDERGLPPFVAPVPASSSVLTSTTRSSAPPTHPGTDRPPHPSVQRTGPAVPSRPERSCSAARAGPDGTAAGTAGDNGRVHPADDQQRLIGGRYRLSVQLGSGAMGTVWSGYDEVLRRRVAVKELKVPPGVPAARGDGDARADDARGARARRALAPERDHRLRRRRRRRRADGRAGDGAVAQPRDADRRAGRAVDGPGRGRSASPPSAALRAAHRAGITHRDVKPGNVLVAHDGRVKLTDFGIARNVADAPMTTAGLVLGSPAYIAPEVAAGQPVTPGRRPVGAGRDAVRRGRGTPALRRARRPGLDDHRGGRRRGAPPQRGSAPSPT